MPSISNPNPAVRSQLETLADWLETDRSRLTTWLQEQPEQANALLKEVFIDVHASSLMGLEPQLKPSRNLLKELASQLGQTQLLNPACTSVPPVMPPNCLKNDILTELYTLAGIHEQQSRLPLVSQPGFDSNYLYFSYDYSERVSWSQRGLIQQLYLRSQYGLSGMADFRRLQKALILAQNWGAQDLEALILLALAQIAASAPDEPTDPFEDLQLADTTAVSAANYLAQARKKVALSPSIRLEAELKLSEALISPEPVAHLRDLELWLNLRPTGETQDYMRLKLGDIWSYRQVPEPAQQLYQQVFARQGKLALASLERLIYQGDVDTVSKLKSRFYKEKDPSTRAVLACTLAARHECQQLFVEFKKETQPQVRQGIARALNRCYLPEDDREAAFKQFENLIYDRDPLVRRAVLLKLMSFAGENLTRQQSLLSGLTSALPERQAIGIWSADILKKAEKIKLILPLLNSESPLVREMALDFSLKYATSLQLPQIKALLPHHDPLLNANLKMLVARLTSGTALVKEIQHQWASYGEQIENQAVALLKSALLTKTLSAEALLPLVQTSYPEQAKMALSVLQENEAPGLQHALIPLLSQPEPEIQFAAMGALNQGSQNQAAIRALFSNLQLPKAYLRRAALLALAKLDFESFAAALPSLIHDPSSQVRKAILEVWDNKIYDATPEQRQLLWPMLKDPEIEIAQEAVNLLASVGESDDWAELSRQFKSSIAFKLKLQILEAFRTADDRQPTDWKPLLIELLNSKEQTPIKENVYDELWHHETGINWYPATEEELLKLRAAQNLIQSSQTPVPEILKLLKHVRLSPILLIDLENLETAPEWAQLLQTQLKQISDPELKKHVQILIEKLK